jgi:Flp pilus assembly protein TadB
MPDLVTPADLWQSRMAARLPAFKMRRLEIQIRRPRGPERRIVFGRFASLVATVVLAVVVIAVLVVALALGYVVIGIALVALLIAVIVAVLRGTWSSIRR